MINNVTYTYIFDNIKVTTVNGDFNTGRTSIIRMIDPNGRMELHDVEFLQLPEEFQDIENEIIDVLSDVSEEELEGESELIVSLDI